MTEPDEALKWAREDWAKGLKSKGARRDVHQGLWDECLDDAVRGYLAGAAASAERIKALEALVQNLMLEARARTMRSNTPITTNIVEMTVPDRVALLKEADQ